MMYRFGNFRRTQQFRCGDWGWGGIQGTAEGENQSRKKHVRSADTPRGCRLDPLTRFPGGGPSSTG